MFDVYMSQGDKIDKTLENNRFEKRFLYEEGDFDKCNVDKARPSIYIDNTHEKLQRLDELKNMMGVKFTFNKGEISRDILQKVGDYIHDNLEVMKVEWGLDVRAKPTKKPKTEGESQKYTLGLLNQILGKWGFQEIKMGVRQRARCEKGGKRVDVSKFNLQTQEKYNAFDEHCLDKKELRNTFVDDGEHEDEGEYDDL